MPDFIFETPPYKHQLEAFQASADKDSYALLMDMGTGKSKVAIDTIGYNFEKGKIDFALMVAPKAVVANLVNEIGIHLPVQIARDIVVWKPDLTKTRREELRKLSEIDTSTLKFLLMNVEAFSTKKGSDVAEYFAERFKAFMVVDESTTIKNRKAQRTKTLCRIGKRCVMRRILTGSPVTRSPMDLYSQMDFLDP